jgi:hypothetical protein
MMQLGIGEAERHWNFLAFDSDGNVAVPFELSMDAILRFHFAYTALEIE